MKLHLDSGPIPLYELYLAAIDDEHKNLPRILSISMFSKDETQKFFEDIWDKHYLFNITLAYQDNVLIPSDRYSELFIYAMKEFFDDNIKIKLNDHQTKISDEYTYTQLAPLIRKDIEQFSINVTYISVEAS